MTGLTYEVDIDDVELGLFLKSKLAKLENLRPFYVNVGEHLLNSVEDRFDTQTDPDGNAWKPLAPATVASRLRRYGNAELTILRASGRLAGSFSYAATRQQVAVGTPVVYAAIQHHGGQAGRNRSVTIPARPVLGLTSNDRTAIAEMAEDFLRN